MAIKKFVIDGKTVAVEILEQHPAYFKFKINDKVFEVSLEAHGSEESGSPKQILNLVINNHPVKIKYSKQQTQPTQGPSFKNENSSENLLLYIINHCTQVLVEPVTQKPIKQPITLNREDITNINSSRNPGSPQAQNPGDNLSLKSPLAGRIVKILVKPGDQVNKNQLLVVIESMKMENEIRATFNGFIKNISISDGNLVQQNQVLITFE